MPYDVKIFHGDNKSCIIVKAEHSERLIDVLEKNGFSIFAPCGGKGICGKCLVRTNSDKKVLSLTEKSLISSNMIDKGYRLACTYEIDSDLEVFLDDNDKTQIVTKIYKPDYEINPVISIGKESTSSENYFGVAFDIGTTTVVSYLFSLRSGDVISSISELNSQRIFGADVISRITYATEKENGLELLRKAICNQIAALLIKLISKNNINRKNIKAISIVGNTTMLHLLQGMRVDGLAASPFTPVNLQKVETTLYKLGINEPEHEDYPVFILPCISAFVGADITSAIIASGMAHSMQLSLLLDIGTNGEIVLGNSDRMLTCSAAAGPAFEGANIKHGVAGIAGAIDSVKINNGEVKITTIDNIEPVGICGSGIIDSIAELLSEGIIDETGKMIVPEFELCRKPDDEKITIEAKDVREIQLAKAAIAAGVNILLKEMGKKAYDIERVFLSGGFGNYINVDSALKIGLLRKEFYNKVINIGNAAGAGAVSAILSKQCYEDIIDVVNKCENVELASRKDFQDEYVNSIFFDN